MEEEEAVERMGAHSSSVGQGFVRFNDHHQGTFLLRLAWFLEEDRTRTMEYLGGGANFN